MGHSATMRRPPTRVMVLSAAVAVCLAALAGHLVRAQNAADQQWARDEKAIRETAFRYYAGLVLGDADMCVGAIAFPLYSLRNGAGALRDEKAVRALVAEVARRRSGTPLSDEDRKQVFANMLAVFEDADIRFVGGDTASVVFVVKPPASKDSGETLAELVLYRKAGKWSVVVEITDSKPTPRMPEPDDVLPPGPSLEKRP